MALAVTAHLDFIRRPTARNWYRAHNASIVAGYLDNEELAVQAELRVERFFINVVLVRVLFAHALVAAPRLALGWLAPLGRRSGDPRVGMTGIFLSLSRVLPDRYPLGDDVDTYVAVEHGFGHMLDIGIIAPRIGHSLRLVVGGACAAWASGLGRRQHTDIRVGFSARRRRVGFNQAGTAGPPGRTAPSGALHRPHAFFSAPRPPVPEPTSPSPASANRPSAVCSTSPSTSSESRARSRCAVSVSHATSSCARVTGESLPRNTSSSRPRTWRSVPA